MYKTRSRNLQRGKEPGGRMLPKRRKKGRRGKTHAQVPRVAMRGVILNVIKGQQEVRLIGPSVVKASMFLDGAAAARGARPGDFVRIYYNGQLGLWCGKVVTKRRTT